MQKKAAFSVVLAGVLWGLITVFIKNLSAAGFDSMQIAFIRLLIAAVLFFAFLAVKDRQKLKFRVRDIWMFLGTGLVSVTLFNACYFYTMIHSQASIAVVLLYTSPVWIMIFSAILFKDPITKKKVLVVAMTLAGCVCVTGMLEGSLVLTPLALCTGLCSGLFYGLYTIFGKYALAKYDSNTVTAYTFLFGMLSSLPFSKFGQAVGIIRSNPVMLLWCLGIGIVSTVLPYVFYTWGLKYLDSGRASILVAVEPLVGAVLGMTVYHEPHSVLKIVGIIIILAAIVILNLEPPAQKKGEANG